MLRKAAFGTSLVDHQILMSEVKYWKLCKVNLQGQKEHGDQGNENEIMKIENLRYYCVQLLELEW